MFGLAHNFRIISSVNFRNGNSLLIPAISPSVPDSKFIEIEHPLSIRFGYLKLNIRWV